VHSNKIQKQEEEKEQQSILSEAEIHLNLKPKETESEVASRESEEAEYITEDTSRGNEETESITVRRSQRPNKGVPPMRLGTDEYAGIVTDSDKEPRTIEEALSGKDRDMWRKSLNDEYLSLLIFRKS